MKANKKSRDIKEDPNAYVMAVGGLVALLLMIIVGIMVFWQATGSIDGLSEQSEIFTSDADGAAFVLDTTNYSAWSIILDNSPSSSSACNITCYNSTAHSVSYPAFTLSHTTVSVAAYAAEEFNQVNATYTSNMANTGEGTTAMATTVFDLLPIIALAIIASIIIGVVIGFGGSVGRL